MAFETGTHCRWMERHIRSLGFRAIVANPAKARISGDPTSKNDRNDARGGRIARRKARLAVARGLAVTVIALLKDPSRKHVPPSEAGRAGFERYRAGLKALPERRGRAAAV